MYMYQRSIFKHMLHLVQVHQARGKFEHLFTAS